MAKKISDKKYDHSEISNKNSVKSIRKGSKIYVKRSNGKWQEAIVYEAYQKEEEYYINSYLNAGGGRIGSKKNLPLKSIIIA